MLKDLNKVNKENQQLRLEIQIQDRKIATLGIYTYIIIYNI